VARAVRRGRLGRAGETDLLAGAIRLAPPHRSTAQSAAKWGHVALMAETAGLGGSRKRIPAAKGRYVEVREIAVLSDSESDPASGEV